jgi:PAS domain S-box-containing protein
MHAQTIGAIGSWRLDVCRNVLVWSEQLHRIFEVTPGTAMTYEFFLNCVHPDDRATVDRAWQAALSGQPYDVEHRVLANGKVKWVRERGELEFTSNGTLCGGFGTCQDITDVKQAGARLFAAKAEAEAANNAKSRFLAAASHDLRQPLAAISVYVGVLKSMVSPDRAKIVANLHDCVESLSGLLTDLLDVSKLEAGVVEPTLADFDVDTLLEHLVAVHSAEAGLKGLRLRWRKSGAIACTDRQILQRIVGNLIDNAIRYTRDGGVLIGCRRHGGKRWIEVWDSGIGIPADQTTLVFEEFKQLDADAQTRGSGLGLAIAAKSAALLGLEIRLRSRRGRGSMFAIELPAGRQLPSVECLVSPPPARMLRIGLVDDNKQVLQALVLALRQAGHEPIAATTGPGLFEALGRRQLDIVISDYRLADGATGFDVIGAARRAFGDSLPAMLITGDTDPVLMRSMADRGIVVLHKPLMIETLLSSIEKATERKFS